MHVAASARRSFPAQSPLQAAALDGSLALLLELLAASDMTLEEGFCAFAFGGGDGDFDVEHRMTYDQFAAVAVGHLASRLSESAIAELFHEGLDLNGDGFVDGGEWLCALHTMQWLHTMHTMQQAAITADEPHGSNVKSTIQLQQQGPSLSLGLQLNGGAAAALMCDSHVMSSDHSVSLNEGAAVGIDSMSAERHRHTPVWLDERQHTKEGMQAYLHVRCKGLAVAVCVCVCVCLCVCVWVGVWVGGWGGVVNASAHVLSQGLRRVYLNAILTHGSLAAGFAALCNCDVEWSQTQCLPLHALADHFIRSFPQDAFDAAVHNFVWQPALQGGVTLTLFVAVMSRAPLLLPHQCCRTMCCVMSMCKANAISRSDLFLSLAASDDGLMRRSEYAERCSRLMSGCSSGGDLTDVWNALFGEGCRVVGVVWGLRWVGLG
jgi:hypothetical protein